MFVVYNIAVIVAGFFLKIMALFNKKLALFVDGRKHVLEQLSYEISDSDKTIWMHCASLGEFEQGRPILEQLKTSYKNHKIILTFFSPSGFEVRKNYEGADVICYLPLDSKRNSKRFIELVHPDLAVFVKYEFWPNILRELDEQKVKTILVSAIFRKEQPFFKSSSWMRKSLKRFTFFFVQDENSKTLLESIDFRNVKVSGDTRFDRVSNITQQNNTLEFLNEFKDNELLVVIGSSWKEDEELLVKFINENEHENVKFAFAPHNIDDLEVKRLQKSIQQTVAIYSSKETINLKESKVLILDTIGMLTKVYSYADIAYVGGGLATGLHNILEPATFGIPVIIGDNFSKFREARELVELKGCYPISNFGHLRDILNQLIDDANFRNLTGSICGEYVKENTGATEQIMKYIHKEVKK